MELVYQETKATNSPRSCSFTNLLFILDEATSGLDVLTEKKVIDNLMSLTDKTILFVAHRLSIAERTNRVIVLDQGKIIEVGSHQELMQAQGFYHHLFNK